MVVQYSNMVDHAKADYITVRRKQLDVELNKGIKEDEKATQMKELEAERVAHFESLKEEVKQYNEMLKTADFNFVRAFQIVEF